MMGAMKHLDSQAVRPAPGGSGPSVLICREQFENFLMEEISQKLDATEIRLKRVQLTAYPGYVVAGSEVGDVLSRVFPDPFIFERQRLARAQLIPSASVKVMARDIAVSVLLPALPRSERPWTIHAFAPDLTVAQPLAKRAATLRSALIELLSDRFTVLHRRYHDDRNLPAGPCDVCQLCLTPEGLWACVTPSERLIDSFPGGIHRMHFDSRAPARSYLKLEEVFTLMGEEPCRGHRVIDLGASPGGWSFSFLRRGCHVLAVDHGPMRIADPTQEGGELTHRRDNGIAFVPPESWVPVDWMVSDMLVPPGTTLGLVRKWLGTRLCRRIVFNIKLPQIHPYPVIRPIEEFLLSVSGLRFQIRQLYHDRREVTVFGRLEH